MKFFAAAALFLGAAMAVPTTNPSYVACSPLFGQEQCCATDVLGIADLNCASPNRFPNSSDDFRAICAAVGQRARCCVLPLLGQGLVCRTPTGITD